MFTLDRIVLSLPKRAHEDWNWPISQEKYLNIDWSVKMPLHCLIMRVAGSQRWAPTEAELHEVTNTYDTKLKI